MLNQVAANIKSMTEASVAALEQLVSTHLVDIITHFTLMVSHCCGLSGTLAQSFTFINQI